MRILILFIILSGLSIKAFSQELSFKKVDSTTYYHYENRDWKGLISYGKNYSFDYYYFNVRMGIAYFKYKKYNAAEKYFKKAIQNNNTDFANEYLFETYIKLGETILAEQVYEELSDETKNRLDYQKKLFEFTYLELGLKNPSDRLIGKTLFGNLAIRHRLGDDIRVFHSFNTYMQKQPGTDFSSRQYHVLGSYYYDNSSLSVGALLASSSNNEHVFDSVQTPGGPALNEMTNTISSTSNSFYVNYNKRFNRLKLNTNFNFVSQNINYNNSITRNPPQGAPPNAPSFTDSKDSSYNRIALIPSVAASYTPNILKDKVSIGAELFVSFTEGNSNFVVKPYLNLYFSDRVWLNTNYLEVKDFLFSDYTSEILYDSPGLSVNRFSGTLNYILSKKFTSKISFTKERYNFNGPRPDYNVNSIFLGIQYKF